MLTLDLTADKIEFDKFGYAVSVSVRFKKNTLIKIADYAKHHYSWGTKRIAEPGGFLYGWLNMCTVDDKDYIEIDAKFTHFDQMAKACEFNDIGLHAQMAKFCHLINEETVRINNMKG